FVEFRWVPAKEETGLPGSSVRARIIDGHFVFHRIEIGARKAFGKVEFVRVRHSLPVHPEPFIETDGVNDQRLSLPVADRVSVVTGDQVFGMRTAIHINDAVSMEVAIDSVDRLEFG